MGAGSQINTWNWQVLFYCKLIGAIQVLHNAIFLEIGPPPTPS